MVVLGVLVIVAGIAATVAVAWALSDLLETSESRSLTEREYGTALLLAPLLVVTVIPVAAGVGMVML